MKKTLIFLIAILLGCSTDCFAQGTVSRTTKQKTEQKKTTPKKKTQTQTALTPSQMVDKGLEVEKNEKKIQTQTALTPSQMDDKGLAAEANGNYSEAVRWYRKAAEQGFAPAQESLGFMYYNGYGVPKDDSEAERWWKKAAAQGNQSAIDDLKNCLGIVY